MIQSTGPSSRLEPEFDCPQQWEEVEAEALDGSRYSIRSVGVWSVSISRNKSATHLKIQIKLLNYLMNVDKFVEIGGLLRGCLL